MKMTREQLKMLGESIKADSANGMSYRQIAKKHKHNSMSWVGYVIKRYETEFGGKEPSIIKPRKPRIIEIEAAPVFNLKAIKKNLLAALLELEKFE